MEKYIVFKIDDLKKVAKALKTLKSSASAEFDAETRRFLQTIASKKANTFLRLKKENLEKLSTELHGLELHYGIDLGQTIYRFMHSFHKN